MRCLIEAMKSVIERVLRGTVLAAAVLAAICLAGCGQDNKAGHDHDADHEHPHAQDEDGREHHGTEDLDADGPTASVAEGDLAAQRKAYPLKVCLVEGSELGSMGEPAEYVHEGRLVRFCCKGCIEDFQAEPLKYLAQLDEATSSSSDAAEEE